MKKLAKETFLLGVEIAHLVIVITGLIILLK